MRKASEIIFFPTLFFIMKEITDKNIIHFGIAQEIL